MFLFVEFSECSKYNKIMREYEFLNVRKRKKERKMTSYEERSNDTQVLEPIMNPTVHTVTQRIIDRSRASRQNYLGKR